MEYLTLDQLFGMIQPCFRELVMKFHSTHKDRFETERGSQYNHQAWRGGYKDHILECMNIAVMLYKSMNGWRHIPFSLSDALVVLYFHDVEKMYPEQIRANTLVGEGENTTATARSSAKSMTRVRILEIDNVYETLDMVGLIDAINNVDGENKKYSNLHRVMSPLAAFCHMCDVASARIWFDYPKYPTDTSSDDLTEDLWAV